MAIFSRRLSNVLKIMLMSISSIFPLLLTLTALAGCSRHLMMYTSCYGNSREIRIACWKKLQRYSCLSGLQIEAKNLLRNALVWPSIWDLLFKLCNWNFTKVEEGVPGLLLMVCWVYSESGKSEKSHPISMQGTRIGTNRVSCYANQTIPTKNTQIGYLLTCLWAMIPPK